MSDVIKQTPVDRTSHMDVIRERKRGVPAGTYAAVGVVALIAVAIWALSLLARQQGGTAVDKSALVTDVVRRGTLLRSVSATGTFAPEHVRIASATQTGLVNQVFVKEGSKVVPGSLVARMENPAINAQEANARSALLVAQAELADAREQAQAAVINQQSDLADAQAQAKVDTMHARSSAQLYKSGWIAMLPYEQAQIQAKKSTDDLRSRHEQVNVAQADAQAKIAAAQAQVDQAAAALTAAQTQVNELTVQSAIAGIVQSVDVDPGTSIAQNTEIARIADTSVLKVVLQVAESDVHDVVTGMPASIDTGNDTIVGRVARIAPAARNGTVEVDVTFAHPLPAEARPDANVDGTIILAKIPNVLSIARPAGASDDNTIDLFKVVDNGTRAVRTRVRLGQGSNERVAVLSGLNLGDTVVVSDMSAYPDQPELRLR
jgi:HlyD family secretion protein